MSWILGYAGPSVTDEIETALTARHPTPLHHFEGASFSIRAGGLPETCLDLPLDGSRYAGGLVVGLGLHRRGDVACPLDRPAWMRRLEHLVPPLDDLDGHFIAMRWSEQRWEAWTDLFGVRTLYVLPWGNGVAFSTRLDWLSVLGDASTLDLEALGSHWLTSNQLTTTSLVEGVERVGPLGQVRFDCNNGLIVRNPPWTPPPDGAPPSAFEQAVTAFLRPALPGTASLSLGLSGGLDSRFLLSLLPEHAPARLHAFGDPSHPDVRLSLRIAADLDLDHRHFHAPVPDAETCLELLAAHVARTQVVSPASAVLGLRHYPSLRAAGAWVIDGGFGEVARRQYMNRLFWQGRRELRRRDAEVVCEFLRVDRADVFTEDALRQMKTGAIRQLKQLWAELPPPEEVGIDHHLDLLALRTRLPNFFGYEQNRLDELVPSYMPLAQPSVVRAVFDLPLRERRGGRLVRRLIRRHRPALARYPLVKGTTTYPFSLTPLLAYTWTDVKKKLLGPGYVDTRRRTFLARLRPFALDAATSPAVGEYPLYDRTKVRRLVEGYYLDGDDALEGALDWWLAFEVWRRQLSVS